MLMENRVRFCPLPPLRQTMHLIVPKNVSLREEGHEDRGNLRDYHTHSTRRRTPRDTPKAADDRRTTL